MNLKRMTPAIAALAAFGLLVSGCSDSSGDTGGDNPNAATGAPIKVGQIIPIEAAGVGSVAYAAGTVASVDAFNERGGVNGRPLQLIQCDSKGDPNTEVDCANKMVSEGAVATLADFTPISSEAVSKILQDAGIARVGLNPVNMSDFYSTNVYTPFSGSLLNLYGMIDMLVAQGKTKLTLMRPDLPVAAQLVGLLTPAVQAKGAEIVNDVAVGAGATDYTQFIAAAERNGAEGVILALGASDANPISQAFEQLGSKLVFALGTAGFSQADLQDLGSFATTSTFTSPTPAPSSSTTDFPGLKDFLADMDKSGKEELKTENLNGDAVNPWLSVRAFGEVASSLKDINKNTVVQGLESAKDLDMAGLIKPWTPSAVEPFGIFQRVSNSMMYRMTFDGDVFVTDPTQYDLRAK
ncbi:ABC transporter substrate-binding protein [Rhodococcus sp. ARC_M6]|uniref:ABC transporter substrate-binding protein n=1 Tax=Rhodococcus sp. ARC_M6 TaxID=2928852 RepID=UPI001FB4813C|nr:ABC transporter substrate-binding protein [Rhodococcus sp. ARC_M6]MCJ0903864.1 ABC transporter substrate-binding protein [Rhodococcus sp. ARC_M6]